MYCLCAKILISSPFQFISDPEVIPLARKKALVQPFSGLLAFRQLYGLLTLCSDLIEWHGW